MENQIIQINLVPNMSTPAVVQVSQYDVGRPLVFKVYDGTSPADLTGVTAVVEGTKKSGLGFSESGTISDNTVTLDTTLAMTQEDGSIPAEIRFSKTGEDVGTANFILSVEKSPHPEGTTDGTHDTMADLQSQLDALDERVDALEAGQSGGLSSSAKQLILSLFSKAAYADDDASTDYDALEALWTTSTKTVTYTLTHVTSSNTAASVDSGQSYTTTLTASTDYTLNTVTVTMGGVDITSTAYSSGTVSIPSVTGNIVITATAVLAAQSITATYTQSGTVYDTDSLDSLKADLVVTANYAGGTSETVTDYTLSGTLTEGTSVITVTYSGLTTTFNVTVSAITPLGVMTGKGSTWASFTDNGDQTYSLDPTPATVTPNLTNPYWTLMNVSDIKGGTLSIEFDDTYKSGSIQVVAYASRNKAMTDVVAALNGGNGWDDTYQFSAATVNVSSDTTIQMYPNAYTWIWIRNGSIIMGDDTTTSNVLKHGYIVDGHITFTIS